MQLYIVWTKNSTGINEKCLLREDGDYIGVETGSLYSVKDGYYASKLYKAKIKSVDNINKTGMYHLYESRDDDIEENKKTFKQNYMNCFITVKEAHYVDELKIYFCLELNEYFSEDEIEILD